MAGFDEIENVFAGKIDETRRESETRRPTPEAGGCSEIFTAETANAVADHGAGACNNDNGTRDAEIDGQAQRDIGRGPRHQPQSPRKLKVPHIPQNRGLRLVPPLAAQRHRSKLEAALAIATDCPVILPQNL